jgi:hypothetical protein
MQHAPWSFVPSVLVPIWLILHAIIAVRLRRAKLGQAASVVAESEGSRRLLLFGPGRALLGDPRPAPK